MTANVTIDVAQVHGVLRIPNAALRFKPETGTATPAATATTGTQRAAGGGAAGGGGGPSPERAAAQMGQRGSGITGAGAAFTRLPRARPQVVWILAENNKLTPVPIRTGITDGHYTEVVGGKLQPGENIVIGLATSKVEGPPPPGSNPMRPGGGPGRGR